MLPARQYWPSLCLNSRSGPQGISTNIGLPKGGLLDYNELCAVASIFEMGVLPQPRFTHKNYDLRKAAPQPGAGFSGTPSNILLSAASLLDTKNLNFLLVLAGANALPHPGAGAPISPASILE